MRRSAAWISLCGSLAIVCAGCGAAAAPKRYVDSQGWSLRYSRPLVLEHSTNGPGSVTFTEVTVANFALRRGVASGRTRDGGYVMFRPPLDGAGRFPADGVAFRMEQVEGGPGIGSDGPDSRFPIAPATFRRSGERGFAAKYYTHRGLPMELSRDVEADAQSYTAQLFIGRAATSTERAAISAAVRSLRFRHLRQGASVNDEQVLGAARAYPVGSLTLTHATGEVCTGSGECHSGHVPFYIVHAPGRLDDPDLSPPCTPVASDCTPPGAFYAIGWKWNGRTGGYLSRCNLRLDRADLQFYCTNSIARWNRVGGVIRRAAGAHYNDPLQFTVGKLTWDGHVTFIPGLSAEPPRGAVRALLWPGVKWS